MPDDERLGGTRDPHEPGRRHRRDESPPVAPQDQPRGRRRRSVESGGVSVADLVQRHTGSRPDLTPVNPDQLRQNGVATGRRARQEDPPPPPSRPNPEPPPPPIAAALDGQGFPRNPRPTPQGDHGHNGFPRDESPRRPGGTSSYFTIPSDALRSGFTQDEQAPPQDDNLEIREVGEDPAFYGLPAGGLPPGVERPRRNGGRRALRGPDPSNGFPQQDGFAPDANGFPPETDAPRHNGRRRAGEASAHLPADGFAPEAPPRPNGRRAGEASVQLPSNGFPPDPEAPRRNGRRRASEAPYADNPRRAGEASGLHGVPGEPPRFPADDARRVGEGSAFHPIPGDGPRNGFPTDEPPNRRRAGEASAHHAIPGNGFPPDEPLGRRRVGEASARFNIPGEGPRSAPDEPPARRRAGEASAPFPADEPLGRRRVGEASAHLNLPGEPPRFAPEEPPARGPRRVGEASTHLNLPGRPGEAPQPFPGEGSGPRGFPPPPEPGGRPQGAARRRAARAVAPPQDLAQPSPFPPDAPPQPGQSSGLFPVDRQSRPLPAPAEPGSEPRLTPAAIDAPDKPRPNRSTGVPPVPLPPPRRDDDAVSMTTEMAAIGDEIHDEVQKRRTIDHTLARFSAVHDEIKAEEREKKAKRRKLRPWERGDDEMDRLDELDAQQSMAMVIPVFDKDDDEEPEEEPEKPNKKKRRWLKGKNAGKAFTIVVAALIFSSTAVAWGFKSYFEANAQTVDALDPDSKSIKDAAAQTGDENFLLVGSDTRAGATAADGVGDDQSVEGARSDTVMIAHIPKDRERVVVVSFPRDLEVDRPACEGWDSKTGQLNGTQHPPAKQVKLNTAYMVGGPKCVTKLVQQLSGLAVNHFVGIDFHGFKDMVDAVQGVEVCVERPMVDTVLGTVVPEAGKKVKISGDQALNFVRARHVEGDKTSDYGRIIRQQRFLSSLLRKAMSSEVLLSPGKLTSFVKAFSKSTFGDNIGIDQLVTLGQSMQGVDAGRVTFITIPTVGIENERHNEDLRVDDANALFEAVRQDTPLPGETPAKQQTNAQQQSGIKQEQQQQPPATVDPKTVKIQVLNGGNKTGGIAGNTADDLTSLGFDVVRVGVTAPADTTVIKYSKGHEAQAQTVKAAVPGAILQEDPSMGSAIMLIIAPGFDGKVQSPTTGGAPAELPDNLSTVNAGDVSCA